MNGKHLDMKETELEFDCRNLAELMGWVAYKGSGRVGAPDKIFLKNGRGWTAEIKRPNDPSSKQRPGQIREQRFLTSIGVPYYLIRSLDDFKKAILNEESKND